MVHEQTTCLGPPPAALYEGIKPNLISRQYRKPCSKPDQRGLTRVGPAFGDPHCFRTCGCNAHHALLKRHLCLATNVRRYDIPDSPELREIVARIYGSRLGGEAATWRTKWPEGKLHAIDAARRDEADRPDRLKLTVKREIGGSRPRGIQAYSSLATQSRFGPQHSVFQKSLFEALQDFELRPGVRVSGTSGWQARDFCDWADSIPAGWVYTECDMSAFDSTVSVAWRERVIDFLRACDGALADHVADGVVGRGRISGDDGCYYVVNGTTKSGHNDTTSGNTLCNALASAFAFDGVPARIIVIGDDVLAAHAPVDGATERAVERYAGLGFSPKAAAKTSIDLCTFAGGVFTAYGGRVLYQPRLAKLAHSLFLTTSPPSDRHRARYMHGIATGFLSTYVGHPFFEAFLRPFVLDGVEHLEGFAHRACGPLDFSPDELRGHFDAYCATRGTTSCDVLRDLRDLLHAPLAPSTVCVHLDLCYRFDTADAAER